MTDEMRAAESLVRDLAPPGHPVPIPEPLAVDESAWFLTAVDKGLVEFTSCPPGCRRRPGGPAGRDHFETGGGEVHHLFGAAEPSTPPDDRPAALHRDYVPCLAAYARAVLDFGYDADRAVLLHRHTVGRRLGPRAAVEVRTDVAFVGSDGEVQLQIRSLGDRQRTRRLATALDASGRRSRLPAAMDRELAGVFATEPTILWLVGPNTIEPANHVFRLDHTDHDVRFRRVDAVPFAA